MGSYGVVRGPILVRITRSQSGNHGSNDACTRTAIVDHGSPGAWHGMSDIAPAMTIACANDAEVLDRFKERWTRTSLSSSD